jgi:Right handed beta helix region
MAQVKFLERTERYGGTSESAELPVTMSVTNASELTAALASAGPGDVIGLADGTYSGMFSTGSTPGTSGNPITLRAVNARQAILVNSNTPSLNTGLTIDQPWWNVRGLKIMQQGRAVNVIADNVSIRNCIIEDFSVLGIRVIAADNAVIEHNVIGLGAHTISGGLDPAGIELTNGVSDTTVDGSNNAIIRNNIIYGTGNNQCVPSLSQIGYGVQVNNNSDGGTVQGNLFFANGGKGIFRLLAIYNTAQAASYSTDGFVIRDNAFLWGEGEMSTGDCSDDSNQFINNLFVNIYQFTFNMKGNAGTNLATLRGNHTLQHNTFYMGPFSRAGVLSATGGPPFCNNPVIGYKVNLTLTNNVFYSPDSQAGQHQLLLVDADSTSGICAGGNCPHFTNHDYNLWWANDSTTTNWIGYSSANYAFSAHEIHAFASQPTFTNAAAGDFSLTGSVGKNAASDGADMGIAYNSYLTSAKLAQAFALTTVQHDSLQGSISDSFAGLSTSHYYQVYYWVPSSSPATTTITFTIEGVSTDTVRDMNEIVNSGAPWITPASRWITLGRHKTADGTLNISWSGTNAANAVDKIFIRKLPTTAEAYAWL